VDKLSHVIRQLGYTPGELKVTLTGILTGVVLAEGQAKRIALKMGASEKQSYILLENAPLEAWLKTVQIGQTTTLTGLLAVYQKQHYLWLLPKEQKRQQEISLKGQFLAKGEQLVFKNGDDEYLVLENALREKVETAEGYSQKRWALRALLTWYQGRKILFLKEVKSA